MGREHNTQSPEDGLLKRHATHDGPCGVREACPAPDCSYAGTGYRTIETLRNGQRISHCGCGVAGPHSHLHRDQRDVLQRKLERGVK